MRARLILVAAMAVAAIALPSTASAATLYTDGTHIAPVAVGTSFTATTVPTEEAFPVTFFTQAGSMHAGPMCEGGTFKFKITQNSGGVFKAYPELGSSFSGCAGGPIEIQAGPPNYLEITGSSILAGTNTRWAATSLLSNKWKWNSFGYQTGTLSGHVGTNPVSEMFTQQPTSAKSPVRIVMNKAGVLSGTSYGSTWVTATYQFTGTAAAYSMG
jgi:hypothetical protein